MRLGHIGIDPQIFFSNSRLCSGDNRDRGWGNFPLPHFVLFAAKRNRNYADQRVGLVARVP